MLFPRSQGIKAAANPRLYNDSCPFLRTRPGILYLTGAVLVYFYPLTADRHAQIRHALDLRGEHGGADPIPEMAEPGVLGASLDSGALPN